MKIGEARKIYSAQIHEYQNQKLDLAKRKKALENKMNAIPNGRELYAEEAATLELSYHAISDKYEEYRKYMEKIMEAYNGRLNAESAKQQGEAIEKAGEDMVKVLEVARRIAKGASVPPSDEQKLMEFSMELYLAAKNLAMMNAMKEKEEYDSLWDDEEETGEPADPLEVAEDGEISSSGAPEIVSAKDTIAAAVSVSVGTV